MFIAPRDRRFQVNPAAMQRAGRAAAGFGFSFSVAARLTLQSGGEAQTLMRIIAKERLQFRVADAFRGSLKTFLTIFEGFDQIVKNTIFLSHTKVSRIPRHLRASFLF